MALGPTPNSIPQPWLRAPYNLAYLQWPSNRVCFIIVAISNGNTLMNNCLILSLGNPWHIIPPSPPMSTSWNHLIKL